MYNADANAHADAHADANSDGYRNTYCNSHRNAQAYSHTGTDWKILSDTETAPDSSASPDALVLFPISAWKL